jgi:transposase
MHIASIGIDIGKTTFHLVALNEHGSIVVRKKFSRSALLTYTANLSSSLIGMETCGGAHFLARALRGQGHDARLIAAKFVKPYRKSNKNDYRDAEAIAEPRSAVRTCASFPSRPTNSSICRACIVCAPDWFVTGRS